MKKVKIVAAQTHKTSKLFLVVFVTSLMCFSVSFAQSDAVVGIWLNQEKEGKIQIYKCGDKYCGKLIWLKNPNDKSGNPNLDAKNPTASLRSKKILGMIFMQDFEFSEKNLWEDGKIYDPKNGKTYACKLTLTSPTTLDVRGYVGASWMGLGRTTTWTRIQ